MVADFGSFRRGDSVRRATSPAHAVKLKAEGWKKDVVQAVDELLHDHDSTGDPTTPQADAAQPDAVQPAIDTPPPFDSPNGDQT